MIKELTLSPDRKLYSIEELKESGASHYKINQLVSEGALVKLNKKYYENTGYNGEECDFYYVSAYAPKGIVCLMSAASYYNLTTYRPDAVDVAIQRKAKISTMPEWPRFSVFYFPDDRFETGTCTVSDGTNEFRETTFDDIVAFERDFASDAIRQSRWKAFIKKKKAMLKIKLQETLDVVIKFLSPVVDAVVGVLLVITILQVTVVIVQVEQDDDVLGFIRERDNRYDLALPSGHKKKTPFGVQSQLSELSKF